jgi:TPR repeat protein
MKIPMTHHLTKPIRAINFMVLALLMTLSSPVAARDFTVAELKPLAEEGSELAQAELGNMYAAGQGVPQDYKEAMKWWLLAAEQGYAVAQTNLGIMYNKGQGVIQDYKEAIKWYRLAAEQGVADAQSNLGVMFEYGHGVLQDNTMAHMWYNIASANGNEKAGGYRDGRAGLMTNADISKAQAMARECMSSGYTKCGY